MSLHNPRKLVRKLALIASISLFFFALPGDSGALQSCCKTCWNQMEQCLSTCFGDPDCVWACYGMHNDCGESCQMTHGENCPVINALTGE
jgi:hypothetical protein